ncbi:hypothetical protein GGP89_001163 [Salinibacter ruber]|uniref:Uncharacterized protein n=1 Tax=Salinibacter ruber TaxID=146919 RepID=A0A9X2TZM2_9BACT|nr:hypothetical protein [Salinibacter ruber]MCS3864615.1 hypothetical protein [Salinibacter ruber]
MCLISNANASDDEPSIMASWHKANAVRSLLLEPAHLPQAVATTDRENIKRLNRVSPTLQDKSDQICLNGATANKN